MARWASAAAMLAVLLFTGCGFRPLYAVSESGSEESFVANELAKIELKPGTQRIEQIVYVHLLDRLTPHGRPAVASYALSVDLRVSQQGVALERDATVSRFNLTVDAGFALSMLDGEEIGDVLFDGAVRAVAGYNILRSEFANVIAERDARERAGRDIADEIQTRLAVYFRGREVGAR